MTISRKATFSAPPQNQTDRPHTDPDISHHTQVSSAIHKRDLSTLKKPSFPKTETEVNFWAREGHSLPEPCRAPSVLCERVEGCAVCGLRPKPGCPILFAFFAKGWGLLLGAPG